MPLGLDSLKPPIADELRRVVAEARALGLSWDAIHAILESVRDEEPAP